MKVLLQAVTMSLGLVAASALAAPTAQVKGGHTSIGLSDDILNALMESHCELVRIKPANIKPGGERLRLPISGGAFDLGFLEGEIDHRGGISIYCVDPEGIESSVSLENFRIDAIPDEVEEVKPMITALASVNDSIVARIDFLEPGGDEFEVVTNGGTIQLRKATLTLTTAAKEFLLTGLGIEFMAGMVIGESSSRILVRKEKSDDHPGNGLAKGKDKDKGEEEALEEV
jgi:hypothetical protein